MQPGFAQALATFSQTPYPANLYDDPSDSAVRPFAASYRANELLQLLGKPSDSRPVLPPDPAHGLGGHK
jgi:hypothetical protein